jgi:hypothetical protein
MAGELLYHSRYLPPDMTFVNMSYNDILPRSGPFVKNTAKRARFNNLRTRMLNRSSTWFSQQLRLEFAGNAYSDEHPITYLGDV